MEKKSRALRGLFLWKLLFLVLVLVPLVFLLYRLVECRLEDLAGLGNPAYHSGMGLYLFASHVLLFGYNLLLTAVAAVIWRVAKKRARTPEQKKNQRQLGLLALAPACGQLLYSAVGLLILTVLR